MPPSTLTLRHPFSHQGIPITTAAVDLTTYESSCPKPALAGPCWTAPFRDGLPTPPGDMTGVTYDALSNVAYGGKPDGIMYGHARPFDSMSSSMVAAAMKPQNPAVTVKEASAIEPGNNQKKTTNTGGSQLRIPSSINGSKGNLAEFAAQVSGIQGDYQVIVVTNLVWGATR